ncbi:hypothetical protein Nepgr_010996 [Nepenthes gracilis]|uniref:Replication protein A subunit n=1 Tax=Nepenthes gracilis TaxID=150966 RepID=A0AAD3SE95_NEPGR|nr:hypothetical protein Nepgr_010996 [Nepenthes gracilis]
MSATMSLTEGAIERMCNGDNDMKPLLQVADIRLVNTSNQNSNSSERYRLLLSDGTHSQQGMLATQRNDLVKSGRLKKGSIVQLIQFVCNLIQGRMIIIIIDLDVAQEKCDIIGEPKQYMLPGAARPPSQVQSSVDQSGTVSGNLPYGNSHSSSAGPVAKSSAAGEPSLQRPKLEHSANIQSYSGSFASNSDLGRYEAPANAPFAYHKAEFGSGNSGRAPSNVYACPPQPAYQQPPPMYTNRGPVAKNEAPPRIVPIAALNPYQGRWTIKARVTAKSELKHYNNPRGDGKVFSFDLLDSDGGEIRVTCFNAVADQFYDQIEAGKVYSISKGSLKPAQKNFNHLRNDHEIFLETTSIVQPCFEDDNTIPRQQFHFRPISDVEGMENNSVVDLIGVVSLISPPSSIMRKNGTETQKRILQLRDMSAKSVELTLWGNFCNAEGQTLQNMCDSGVFPVLAIKSVRVSDFNGKAVGTLSTSLLFIEPDFPEARRLKDWFDKEGRNIPSVSIARETRSLVWTDARKTVSQIRDEKLGTSEKPDWITVCAAISFIKVDNFCYTACPIMIGDRKCSKKVMNNGDGKWRCDRCDQSVNECDYRYILQFQIQDHTGLTWVTAFQECGEEIMGMPAKNLYCLKYEEQDDEKFNEIIHGVLFAKYMFKLKVKEETFSDEQRVKSTVIKSERVNFSSESRFLLDLMDKLKSGDSSGLTAKAESTSMNTGVNNSSYANAGTGPPASTMMSYGANSMIAVREIGVPTNQRGQYGNQYNSSGYPVANPSGGMYLSCGSCGGSGHISSNCPSIMNSPGQPAGGYVNRAFSREGTGNSLGECYKCHQFGHWARDCPGLSSVPPAYGSSNITPGRYGGIQTQHIRGI